MNKSFRYHVYVCEGVKVHENICYAYNNFICN